MRIMGNPNNQSGYDDEDVVPVDAYDDVAAQASTDSGDDFMNEGAATQYKPPEKPLVPPSWCHLLVKKAEQNKPDPRYKDEAWTMFKFTFVVNDGPHKGAHIFHNFNVAAPLANRNSKDQDIAEKAKNSTMMGQKIWFNFLRDNLGYEGKGHAADLQSLVNLSTVVPLFIDIEPAKNQYPAKNKINFFKELPENFDEVMERQNREPSAAPQRESAQSAAVSGSRGGGVPPRAETAPAPGRQQQQDKGARTQRTSRASSAFDG